MQHIDKLVGMEQLRKAIPGRCFEPSLPLSIYFYLRDIALMGALLVAAMLMERQIYNPLLKAVLCAGVYPFLVGMPATGFWVLGHEAGHGAFSKSRLIGDLFGFVAHSFLMSPYFSWRSTHSRHHVYANHMLKVLCPTKCPIH